MCHHAYQVALLMLCLYCICRWLYTLYLMIDANFRARCKDRGFDDIELAPGWSYYVEEKAYQKHIAACAGQKEVHVCRTVDPTNYADYAS